MDSLDTLKALIESFGRTNSKYNIINNKHDDYCTGVDFPPAEINTLVLIHKYKDKNITEIAHLLGVTKSAASQTIIKLEKKKVVIKYKDNFNGKNILIGLTPLGIKAIETYEEYRIVLFKSLINSLGKMSQSEINTVIKFLNQVELFMDEHI